MRNSVLVAAALAASSPLALAQEGESPPSGGLFFSDDQGRDEGDTIVIARKREEVLEDVPQSITVVDADTIEAAGLRTVRDASVLVPNLNVTEFSSRRLSFPYLRGIGSGLGEPAVVTYVDGVPQLTTGSSNLPLVDLDRIEFLRGPQGTLYGRNAVGGLIHLISREPQATPRWDASASFGEFDFQEYSLSYSGPVGSDDILLNFSARQTLREGFTDNDFTGNDVDDRDSFYGRAQLYLTPTDDSSLRIGLYGETADDGGFVLNDIEALKDDPHTINQDFEGVAERDVFSPSVVYELYGDGVDFTSITSFTDWDVKETSDFDFSPFDLVVRTTEEDQEYFYQELRFSSSKDDGAPAGTTQVNWVAGLSGFVSDSSRSSANDLRVGSVPPGFEGIATDSGDFDDEAIAAFGEVTVEFAENWEVSIGGRFDHESKEADLDQLFEGAVTTTSTEEGDEDYDEFVPRLSVAYDANENTRFYGLAAKGFKAGGFNAFDPADADVEYGTEESWTYEAGVKVSSPDGRLRMSASLFYIDWEDMQISLFDPAAGGFIDNAGESNSKGIEVEVAAKVTEGFDVLAGIGVTESEFDDFEDSSGNDFAGNELPFAAAYTWNLGAQYSHTVGEDSRWFVRADFVNYGDFHYDPSNAEEESYDLVNVRAGMTKGDWGLDLFLRNAFDEEYIPIAVPLGGGLYVGENGAPRMFGATLRLSF
ncbi:MAG: TonB-dependent receptor [bacterium]|nr:TonB-dependent receptor [bacterium]